MYVFPPLARAPGIRTADPQAMRSHNASVLANLVWGEVHGISQAELARRSGLSRSTVSAIVADLVGAGLVVPGATPRVKSGRPPTLLCFDTEAHHIIGVEMGSSHVAVALCDLRGEALWFRSEDCDVPHDPPETLRLIGALVAEARSLPEARGSLLGIGVAAPCPVDSLTLDRLSPRLLPAWGGVRLGAELYHRFGVRLFIDNDANCGALAEAWRGGREPADFAYIKLATGVGGGLIIGGQPYHGSSGIAGEIGHTSVDPHGRPCRCGLRGCLEAEVGSPALVAKAREALAAGRSSTLPGGRDLGLADIVAAAHDGDSLALELIAGAGRHLGVALANLLNLLNPARVVLGGRLSLAGEHLLTPLRRAVLDRALWTSIERAEIVASTLGDEQEAIGAATLVLRAALEDLSVFHAATGSPAADLMGARASR